MATDIFGSSLIEDCGHKCSRPPLNVVPVSGCQDVKPKVIRAPNGALDSATVPQPGVWLINAGGSGREGTETASGGQEEGGASRAQVDMVAAVRMLIYADEPVFYVAVVLLH